jgi:DNA-directed RNA polymerase subunit RPC12/RpoP
MISTSVDILKRHGLLSHKEESIMRCDYCGHEHNCEQDICSHCGTKIMLEPSLQPDEFGRGEPIAFFEWLYKYLPYFYGLSIIYTVAGLYHILVNLYGLNVALFVSIFANAIFINMRLANIILMIVIISFRIRKDKTNFARFFVYKHMLQIVELIALFVVGGAQIGLVDGLTETFVREMFFNLLVFIPVFRYFNKRITIFGFGET